MKRLLFTALVAALVVVSLTYKSDARGPRRRLFRPNVQVTEVASPTCCQADSRDTVHLCVKALIGEYTEEGEIINVYECWMCPSGELPSTSVMFTTKKHKEHSEKCPTDPAKEEEECVQTVEWIRSNVVSGRTYVEQKIAARGVTLDMHDRYKASTKKGGQTPQRVDSLYDHESGKDVKSVVHVFQVLENGKTVEAGFGMPVSQVTSPQKQKWVKKDGSGKLDHVDVKTKTTTDLRSPIMRVK